MATLGMKISTQDLPESENNFEPIAAGIYTAQIETCEPTKTKDGEGTYLKMKFKILAPTNANRVIFTNLNIVNKNDTCQRIGLEALRNLLVACEVTTFEDTDQIVGKMVDIKVKIRPAKGEYGPSNDISGYSVASGGVSAPVQTETKATPSWASASKVEDKKPEQANKPAWMK